MGLFVQFCAFTGVTAPGFGTMSHEVMTWDPFYFFFFLFSFLDFPLVFFTEVTVLYLFTHVTRARRRADMFFSSAARARRRVSSLIKHVLRDDFWGFPWNQFYFQTVSPPPKGNIRMGTV